MAKNVRYEHTAGGGETIDLLETLENIRKSVEGVGGYLPWLLPLLSHHVADEQTAQCYGEMVTLRRRMMEITDAEIKRINLN